MLQETDIPEDVITKITKVLNLAENAGTPGEAEAAAAMAAKLLTKYNLSVTDIRAWEASRTNYLGHITEIATDSLDKDSARKATWIHYIALGVAKSHFCHPMTGRRTVFFIGREKNAAQAARTFNYLYQTLTVMVESAKEKYRKEYSLRYHESPWSWESPATWRSSWLKGAAASIYAKLMDEHKQATEVEFQTSAIVLRTDDENKAYLNQQHPNTRTVTGRNSGVSAAAYQAGKEFGEKFNPHPDRALDQ